MSALFHKRRKRRGGVHKGSLASSHNHTKGKDSLSGVIVKRKKKIFIKVTYPLPFQRGGRLGGGEREVFCRGKVRRRDGFKKSGKGESGKVTGRS